jgi:hypothetical protein
VHTDCSKANCTFKRSFLIRKMNDSTILRSIISNNDGVAYIEKGTYEHAITSFGDALEILANDNRYRDDSQEGHFIMEIDCQATQATIPVLVTPSIPAQLFPDQQCGKKQIISRSCDASSQEQHFVYSDPISIPPKAADITPNKRLYSKLCIVVMFNLAMSFHLAALQQKSLERLMRAQRLYELAFQMHLEENCDVTMLFSLALMNNLGSIYHVFCDQERSYRFFQHLLSTMMLLVESDEARAIKRWDGLMSNVMGLIFAQPPCAARAA